MSDAPTRPRVDVLGVLVDVVDLRAATTTIRRWIETGDTQYVCVTGVHGVMESQRDASLLAIHNRSGLTVPDGRPLVWAGRWAGADGMDQCRGFDLVDHVCAAAAAGGWRVFFYGGAEGVPERLGAVLSARHGGLTVVGTYSPPFRALTEDEQDDIARLIDERTPDIVFVGLSTPKQERWMAEFRERLRAPVLIGVGAAFDMHLGAVPQAPRVMQRLGMEWLFRLVLEPRRLWRRYAVSVPGFLGSILRRRPRVVTDASGSGA